MRVLFEATPLVWAAASRTYRSGIPRYIVELIQQFEAARSGVEVTLGVWDDDVIACALASRIPERWPDLVDHLSHGYQSRFHLAAIYRWIMDLKEPGETRGVWRVLAAASRVFTTLDRRRERASQEFDIYHSPHVVLSNHRDLAGVPRVLTIHDLLPLTHPQFFTRQHISDFRRLLKQLVPHRDTVICDSRETQGAVVSLLGVPESRCWHVPLATSDGVRPVEDRSALARSLTRWNLEPDRYVLSVGTLEPRKNLVHLLRCYSELDRAGELGDWKLVLAGSMGWGTALEEIREFVARSAGKIVLSGPVSDEDLCALYSGAGLFVFVPIAEGFGLPPLEAMRCGAPVVTSNCSSLPEVVGEAAILVDPTDPAALGAAMRRLADDEPLRSELRLRGFARAKEFSWKRTAELTREVYRQAIESGP